METSGLVIGVNYFCRQRLWMLLKCNGGQGIMTDSRGCVLSDLSPRALLEGLGGASLRSIRCMIPVH